MLERLVVGFYLACGVLLIFLSTIIWRENPKGRVNRTTALMLAFAGLGPIFAAVGQTLPAAGAGAAAGGEPFYRSLQYVWELFFPFLLLFSLEFPARHALLRRRLRVRWLIFVPHVFHIMLVVAFARFDRIAAWLATSGVEGLAGWLLTKLGSALKFSDFFFRLIFDVHLKFFSVVNLAYVVAALVVLQQSQATLSNPRLRSQVGVLQWALRIALGLYALAYIAPILSPIVISPALELALIIVALLVGAGGVAYGIIRHQFLDVRLIARQSIVYTVTSAVLVGLYLLVIGQLGSWLRAQVGHPVPILEVGFVIVAVIFFQPVMTQVEDLIQRFFLRDRTDYRRLMQQFSTEIIRIVDLRQLQAQIISSLQDGLMIESVMLAQIQHNPERVRFFSMRRLEGEYAETDIGEFLTVLDRVTEPVYFESLTTQAGVARIWTLLASFKAFIVVPLRAGQEMAGFLVLSRKQAAYRYSQEDFTVLHMVSNQVAVALSNASLYTESLEKRRMEEELAVARQIQLALLPSEVPQSPHFVLDAFSKPAREVGGDFYDFLHTPSGRLGVVIGDASGKSVGAALMIAQLQAVLRNEAATGGEIPRIMANLNRCVAAGSQGERFVTMVYGELDAQTGHFRYCNAGHNYPVLARSDGSWQTLDTGGLLLGVFADAQYEQGEVYLDSKDVLVFYTDGLSEVINGRSEEFGDRRLVEAIVKNRIQGPQMICQSLLQEVLTHAETTAFEDDATVIVLKKLDGTAAP